MICEDAIGDQADDSEEFQQVQFRSNGQTVEIYRKGSDYAFAAVEVWEGKIRVLAYPDSNMSDDQEPVIVEIGDALGDETF